MNAPAVFVSCVSPEFRTTRDSVAHALTRLGYTPITQEIFGTEPGDLRQVLRDKIDLCQGLIQIIGQAYGAEPPSADADFGRVSYTQFEFLYARQRGLKAWLIFAADGYQADKPLDQLDLPFPGDPSEPAGYQAERRKLQNAYREARQADGHLYHPVATGDQLLLRVERMRDHLGELRRAFQEWQAEVLRKLDERAVTKEKIRAHLFEAAEKTHQAALAEADKEKGWQRRQQLRDAAEQEHAVRLSRIDDLAASFAEIEGTAKSTAVFDEMSRILAEEGVDEALAYVGSLRKDILGAVMARNVMAREKNRAELRPLLHSAQLHAGRAAYAEAASLLNDILALEPDWPDALDRHFWFLIDRGDRAVTHGTLKAARVEYAHAETIAAHLLASNYGDTQGQFDLGISSERLGDLAVAQGQLEAAKACYAKRNQSIQRLAESDPGNAEWQRDLSVSFNKLGDLAISQGKLPEAQRLLADSLRIRQRLAESDPGNAAWQRDLSISLEKLGNLAVAQGNLPEAQRLFGDSLRIAQRLAESDPGNAAWQRDLSVSLIKLGDVAVAQGNLPEAQRLFADCMRICQRLAESDPGNAARQRDLSVSLNELGDLAVAQGNLPEAQRLFAEDLRIAQRLAESDPGNAEWQRDLSVSLEKLGELAVAQGNLPEAQRLFADSLRIRQRLAESDPGNAAWQRDLWVLHWKIADLLEKQGDGKANDYWRKAHDVLAAMVQAGMHVPPEDLVVLEASAGEDRRLM